MNKNGLKLKVAPKGPNQRTLEDAFTAGVVYKQAKELKRQALKAKSTIEVNSNRLELKSFFCDN